MALFNSEAKKNVQPEVPVKPQSPPVQAAPVPPPAHVVAVPPPAAAQNGVASRPQVAPASAEDRAYLDAGSKVTGKLNFEGPARVDGQIEGEITARDSLMIGESAVVTAQIKAKSIIVAGTVSGEISASQRIEIRPSAKVSGNLVAPKLVVHEGAVFEGNCAMQTDETPAERKVPTLRREERAAAQVNGRSQAAS
jgi:cytoskeletal protein CcmA (bactofilin family)